MLYTSEKLPFVLVGWQHVLFGRIFSTLGFGVIETYELALIFSLLLFLILAYKLIRIIFPLDRNKRILAYFFFVSSNSLFKIINTPNGPVLSYFWYWYNHGFQQVRFGPTPHHLLANSFYTLILILAYYWFTQKKPRYQVAISLVISSVVLSSINPVYWGLATLTLGAVPLLMLLLNRIRINQRYLKKINVEIKKYFSSLRPEMLFAPFVLILLPGLPVALIYSYSIK